MGIGISYTGHDGKTRHFDSGETARKFLDSLAPEAKRHTGEALRRAMQGIPSPLQGQGGKAKVMPGGSVVDTQSGLCLRGEEASPLVEGVRMFASVNGSKGFKSIAEIDPPGSAPVNGPMFGCDSEDEDASEAKGGEAARIPFVSRTKAVVGEWTKTIMDGVDVTYCPVTFYEFIRELVFSPAGRLVGCTRERRRQVGSFMVYMGGGGGKYGVRLFSVVSDEDDPVHPTPDVFAFGSEADLDTYDEDSGQFGCNYEDGQVKDDPPVKIIAVTTCPGGVPGGE